MTKDEKLHAQLRSNIFWLWLLAGFLACLIGVEVYVLYAQHTEHQIEVKGNTVQHTLNERLAHILEHGFAAETK